MKIHEFITEAVIDYDTQRVIEIINMDIKKGKINNAKSFLNTIKGYRLAGIISYKEDVQTILDHFGFDLKNFNPNWKPQVQLMADTGGAGGGGAGGTGGASAGGDGGSTGSSGDSGSADGGSSGDSSTPSADSTPSDAPVSRGFLGFGSIAPYKKSKKKKKKFKYGDGIYEASEEELQKFELALQKAREITKQIKYDRLPNDIIIEIDSMAEELGIPESEIDMYTRDVYKAKNNLESAVYELESIFADKVREIQNKLDDEDI